MPTISIEEVQRIAKLARVGLTNIEAADAAKKLNDILGHFSAIQSINTKNVAPADDASGLQNIARADVAKPDALCTPEDLLARAPRTSGKYLQVPAVFE